LRAQPVVPILEKVELTMRRHFDPPKEDSPHMKTYTAVVERCADTGLFVGYVPGFAGAHSQAESLDELNRNLREVIEMLLEDGEPRLDPQFVGTQTVTVS
jgi:predicted RNase H-like HicB family nuclease